jgi:hypothetical protein
VIMTMNLNSSVILIQMSMFMKQNQSSIKVLQCKTTITASVMQTDYKVGAAVSGCPDVSFSLYGGSDR